METLQARASTVQPIVERAMQAKRPIFLWGAPGIGKSEIVEQITNSLPNSLLIDNRLSLWEPTDIKGIPYFDSNTSSDNIFISMVSI